MSDASCSIEWECTTTCRCAHVETWLTDWGAEENGIGIYPIGRPGDRERRCHPDRTRLELIAERKVRRRQLTGDANIEITGRDLRERDLMRRQLWSPIRKKVGALKKQGRSRDEIVAAKPTAAFDAKFGNFVIDPAFFTRLVYEGV